MSKIDFAPILFLCLFAPLFFYNLGGTSLVDFDEGWYAEVSRNILLTKQPFLLFFNGKPFLEHPPTGYLLIALSFLIFGVNEFASRFPSALSGFGSLVVLYLIGKNLFNRAIGLGASLMLVSSVWFIFRSRTGNLDSVLLFFFLITFYLALKINKNIIFLYLFSFSLGFLFLVKSLVGISVLIPSTIVFIQRNLKMSFKEFTISILSFFSIVGPWFLFNYSEYGSVFVNHLIQVGLRTGNYTRPNFQEIFSSLTFLYLHFGIQSWYYPGLASFVGSLPLIFKEKNLLPIYALLIILLSGFLTNSKTEIWHLIPLYPFIGLLIAFLLYQMILYSQTFLRIILGKTQIGPFSFSNMNKITNTSSIITFLLLVIIASLQIYSFRYEVKLFDREVSGLAYTSKAAQDRSERLFLDNTYFLPSSVFYSRKEVDFIRSLPSPQNNLTGIIDFGPKPFLLLTENWKLETDKINPEKYLILAEHSGYVLLKIGN